MQDAPLRHNRTEFVPLQETPRACAPPRNASSLYPSKKRLQCVPLQKSPPAPYPSKNCLQPHAPPNTASSIIPLQTPPPVPYPSKTCLQRHTPPNTASSIIPLQKPASSVMPLQTLPPVPYPSKHCLLCHTPPKTASNAIPLQKPPPVHTPPRNASSLCPSLHSAMKKTPGDFSPICLTLGSRVYDFNLALLMVDSPSSLSTCFRIPFLKRRYRKARVTSPVSPSSMSLSPDLITNIVFGIIMAVISTAAIWVVRWQAYFLLRHQGKFSSLLTHKYHLMILPRSHDR
jgi:hypothetical protein